MFLSIIKLQEKQKQSVVHQKIKPKTPRINLCPKTQMVTVRTKEMQDSRESLQSQGSETDNSESTESSRCLGSSTSVGNNLVGGGGNWDDVDSG